MSQPQRKSTRINFGKPPQHLLTYEMAENNPESTPIASGSRTATPTTAAVKNPKPLPNPLDDVRREFSQKMSELQSEFQKQMHSIQHLVLSNMQQLRAELQPTTVSAENVSNIPPVQSGVHSNPPTGNMSAQSENGSIVTNSQTTIGNRHKKIYPLPIFSGSPEEWQTFYEAFTTTTEEFEYSNLHNIMRMREALQGKARETVESLLSSSENVVAILEILKETFGRPEQLMKSQIEKVRSIPAVADGNLEALVEFANKIANMTTFLKNVQGHHHLSNPMLLCELLSKLPLARQMQWAEKCLLLNGAPTIVDFNDWLSTLRRLANMVNDSLPSTSQQAAVAATCHPGRRPPHATKRFAGVSVAAKRCSICNGDCKATHECRKFLNLSPEDRWKMVKTLKHCFSCLRAGHQVQSCNFKNILCGTNGCTMFHHRLLHFQAQNTHTNTQNGKESDSQPSQHGPRNCHVHGNTTKIFFQILPIHIHVNGKSHKTYAFFDDGANVSMMDKDFAHELGLHGTTTRLELQWLNDRRVHEESEVVQLTISGTDPRAEKYHIQKIFTTKNLSLPKQSCQIGEFAKSPKTAHLKKLNIENYSNVQPKLILSLNHAFLTVPIEKPIVCENGGPIAIKTRLGWLLYGPVQEEEFDASNRVMHVRFCEEKINYIENMNSMMKNYFDMETLGVKLDAKKIISKAEERAMNILKQTTVRIGERYESGMLWRDNFSIFPDSYKMAEQRLASVERKMARDEDYAKEYRAKISDYVQKGYARKLSPEEARKRTEKTFYLPHFGVKTPNKPKLRLVFDAAAEVNGFSLNKALLTGPDLNQPLLSILFKFREAPVAVCGDIKEMFHQILIKKEDQDSQRFLWREGGDLANPVETYVMERMIFGTACSPTVAQYVKNSNAQLFIEKYPRAVKVIIENHYVDDYVDCFESTEEALSTLEQVLEIHNHGGFNLRNIISNSAQINRKYGSTTDNFDWENFNQGGNSRILGMNWKPGMDPSH